MMRLPPLWVVTAIFASIFAARAALRLVHHEFYVLQFAVLAWPAWMVWSFSVAELAGALLLLRRATFRWGALVLGLVAGAFTIAYLRTGAPLEALGPGGLLLGLAGLAFLRRLQPGRGSS